MRKFRLKKKVKVVLACICLSVLSCVLLFASTKTASIDQVQKVNKVALHRANEVLVSAQVKTVVNKSIKKIEEETAKPISTETEEVNNIEEADAIEETVTDTIIDDTQTSTQEVAQEQVQEVVPQETYQAPTTYSQGQLTPSAGVFYGPSGKETYYNLDMSGVIAIANAEGIYGNYWIRSDGVKMLGNYVMCACSFDIRPRGTLVETSLGTGICVDTGTFAVSDQTQIDIAVSW